MRLLTITAVALALVCGAAEAGNGKNSNKVKPGSPPVKNTVSQPSLPDWDGTVGGAAGGAVVRPDMGLGGGQPSSGCYSLGC